MRDLEHDALTERAGRGIPALDRPLHDLSTAELRESDREILRLQRTEPYDSIRERMADTRIRIMREAQRRGDSVYDEVYR